MHDTHSTSGPLPARSAVDTACHPGEVDSSPTLVTTRQSPTYRLPPRLQTVFPPNEAKPPSSPHQPLPVSGTPVATVTLPQHCPWEGWTGGRDEAVFSFLSGSSSISWAYWVGAGLDGTCTCH